MSLPGPTPDLVPIASSGQVFVGPQAGITQDSTKDLLLWGPNTPNGVALRNLVTINDANYLLLLALLTQSVKTLATQINTVTVTSNAESTLIGNLLGSATLPANFMTVGKTIRIVVAGLYSTVAFPNQGTIVVRFKIGGVNVVATPVQSLQQSQANQFFRVEILMTCKTVGAGGTVDVVGEAAFGDAGFAPDTLSMTSSAAITFDTTAAKALNLTSQFSANNLNSIKSQALTIEALN